MVSTRLSRLEGHRRKFMAVIDDTPECGRAVHYAGMRAKTPMAASFCSYVIADADFQQWLGVEGIMRAEAGLKRRRRLPRSLRPCAKRSVSSRKR